MNHIKKLVLTLFVFAGHAAYAFEYLPCKKGGVAAWKGKHELLIARDSLSSGTEAGEAVRKGMAVWFSDRELSLPIALTDRLLEVGPNRFANSLNEILLADLSVWRLPRINWLRWDDVRKNCQLAEADVVLANDLSLDSLELHSQQSMAHVLGLEISNRPGLTNNSLPLTALAPDDLQGLRFLYPPELAKTEWMLTPWTFIFSQGGFRPSSHPNLIRKCSGDSFHFSFQLVGLGTSERKLDLQLGFSPNSKPPESNSPLMANHRARMPGESWMPLSVETKVPTSEEASAWRLWGRVLGIKGEVQSNWELLALVAPEKGQCGASEIVSITRDDLSWVDPITRQELARMSAEEFGLWRPKDPHSENMDPASFFEMSEGVLYGKVTAIKIQEMAGVLWSKITLEVKETLKGPPLKQLIFWQPGGEEAQRGEAVMEMPALQMGQLLVGFFTYQPGPHPWAMGRRGVFFLRPGKTGRVVDGQGLGLVKAGPGFQVEGPESMTCLSCDLPKDSALFTFSQKNQSLNAASPEDFLKLLRRFKQMSLADTKKTGETKELVLDEKLAQSYLQFAEKKSLPAHK